MLLSTQAVLCVGRRRRRGAAKYTSSTLCGEEKEEEPELTGMQLADIYRGRLN